MALRNPDFIYYMWISFVIICGYHIALEVFVHITVLVLGYLGYKYLLKQTRRQVDIIGQGVVITGCDTGFGHHAALAMDKLGFTVYAGCLYTDSQGAMLLKKNGTKRLHVLQMDVTSDDQVKHAQQYVMDNPPSGGFWAVINNAAINRMCDFELASIDIMKRVAEVNYWGMLRTTKTFLPLIRKNKGRIINVTSVRGRVPFPTDTCYGTTKFAAEAFSGILRREMFRFGVKVIVIEPANFGGITGMLNEENIAKIEKDMHDAWSAVSLEVKEVYGQNYKENLLSGLRSIRSSSHPTVDPVIDAMIDATVNCNPQYRYLVKGGNNLLDFYHVAALLNGFLPESMMDRFIDIMDPPPAIEMGTIN